MDLRRLLVFLLGVAVLAALVGNAAAGLAGGLARGLALAAAALGSALAEVAGVQGNNVLHNGILHFDFLSLYITVPAISQDSGRANAA